MSTKHGALRNVGHPPFWSASRASGACQTPDIEEVLLVQNIYHVSNLYIYIYEPRAYTYIYNLRLTISR